MLLILIQATQKRLHISQIIIFDSKFIRKSFQIPTTCEHNQDKRKRTLNYPPEKNGSHETCKYYKEKKEEILKLKKISMV